MDSWYDIVKSYDDPKTNDPTKKNDGTYSQSSVVILLIYLTFGEDHPYHIARYFEKTFIKPLEGEQIRYSSNLRTSKVGTLLNKMKEDQLVTVTEKKVKNKLVKIYSINPRIVQSPIRDGALYRRDGSSFEIPLNMVKQLLARMNWKHEGSKAVFERDEFFKVVVYPDAIDYFLFLEFIQTKAFYQEVEIRSGDYNHRTSSLEKLLADYYHLLEELCNPDIRYV